MGQVSADTEKERGGEIEKERDSWALFLSRRVGGGGGGVPFKEGDDGLIKVRAGHGS